MPHRAYLFSLRIGHALRESFKEKYSRSRLIRDILAGITVGIIAIPLAMALAIAVGVAPQYGLYTTIIAGFVIALTGGSRFSISGPTAAFVVILYPIVTQYGLGGLLIATIMAGILLVIMAYAKLGRLIEYIPESVTLGFTAGIAVVIAVLQIKDLFGLTITEMPEHFIEKISVLMTSMPDTSLPNLSVGLTTLMIMLIWPRLKTPIPPHLPAVIIGGVLAYVLNQQGFSIETIGSRFHYALPDGSTGNGIPPFLPSFNWPWELTDNKGESLVISWELLRDLLPDAFAIAMLGAIESLLCAVVLDGMTGKRHSANSELLGQGLGNIITPFFGGITATAAIARSAANYKAGATSPVSAMIHSLVVLAGLVYLASLLAYLPMAGMAALLLMVAWNMSEAPKAMHLIKTAPKTDILVFATCFSLTIFIDMVIAITTGILLAAVLFMREIAQMTKLSEITDNKRMIDIKLPQGWRAFKISGPLFFAAADRIFAELSNKTDESNGIILYLDAVPVLDSGGIAALNKLIAQCEENNTKIYFADWQFQPLKTLAKAKLTLNENIAKNFPTLQAALQAVDGMNS